MKTDAKLSTISNDMKIIIISFKNSMSSSMSYIDMKEVNKLQKHMLIVIIYSIVDFGFHLLCDNM